MPRLRSRTRACLAAGLLLCVMGGGARAQTLTQDQALTFGDVVMFDNSSPRDLRLLPSGNYTADPGYYVFDAGPQLGEYSISGQTPNWIMDITIDVSGANLVAGGGAFFTLVDPFTVPPVVTTDALGNATFQIGGTLRSNGNGVAFVDVTYSGDFIVTVAPN